MAKITMVRLVSREWLKLIVNIIRPVNLKCDEVLIIFIKIKKGNFYAMIN